MKSSFDMVYGLNSVRSVLDGTRKIEKVLMTKQKENSEIFNKCANKNVPFKIVDKKELDSITKFGNHQGFVAFVEPFKYKDLKDFLNEKKEEQPLILILDGIEDPNNFGSLIRTSAAFGVDAIIISKDRQIQMTPTVTKVSTGAEEFVSIIQVTNIVQSMNTLKKNRYWIVTADGRGDRLYDEIDYKGKMAIVIGSEGRGASRLTLENSDFIARIPIQGPITSLNAAVAGAIMISGAIQSRRK